MTRPIFFLSDFGLADTYVLLGFWAYGVLAPREAFPLARRAAEQALRLDPSLSVAALNRGMLNYRAKRYDAAISDLQRAGQLGADPAVVFFDLALANLARGERAAALDKLRQALRHNPQQPDARKLYDSLVGR